MRPTQRFVVAWITLSLLVGSLSFSQSASAGKTGPIVFLDASDDIVRDVNFTVSHNSSAHTIKVRVNTTQSLSLLAEKTWVEERVSDLALENLSYSLYNWSSKTWYRIELDPEATIYVDLHPFQPVQDRSVFSKGSRASVLLERPMFIRVQEVLPASPPITTDRAATGPGRIRSSIAWVRSS